MNEAEYRKELRRIIEREFGAFHGCIAEAARQWGEHRSYLSAAINGLSSPSPTILKATGYRKVVSYEKVAKRERQA